MYKPEILWLYKISPYIIIFESEINIILFFLGKWFNFIRVMIFILEEILIFLDVVEHMSKSHFSFLPLFFLPLSRDIFILMELLLNC